MKEKDINKFKELLLDRKEQIEKNINDAVLKSKGLNDSDPKDEADSAFLSTDNFTGNAIAKQQQAELDEIMEALSKINSSIFGICEMCEENISIARLNVKPFAKYCIDCREIIEKNPQR